NEEGNKTEPIVIATHEEDITGDGIKETVELKGVLLSEDSGFFHQVWADITSEHDKEWKISYESGYDPTLTFNDLNHDKVTELIYRSAADDGELNHSHIHTLKNEKVTEIHFLSNVMCKETLKTISRLKLVFLLIQNLML